MPTSLTLSDQEQRLLSALEETIQVGLETFQIVGRALMTINEQRLYRASYQTFKEYCEKRWGMTRQHAYRLIGATSFADQLSPNHVRPTHERQIRPLLTRSISEEKRLEIWEKAVAAADGGQVTAKHIEAIIRGTERAPKPREFGDALTFRGLRYAPINEQGVVFLFGMVSQELGFFVESVHIACPDCTAKRRVIDKGKRRWREVRIEFEYQSRNYLPHLHRYSDCDLIVCWEHNWPECPIEVIALKEEIKKLPSDTLSPKPSGKIASRD